MNKNIQKPIEEYLKKNSQKVVDFTARDRKVKYSPDIKSHREIKTISGDEEAVRGYLVAKLVNELGYKKENIELEKEYDIGRPKVNKPRIDIIVRDDKGNAFLYIEAKSPQDYEKDKDEVIEKQLFNLASQGTMRPHQFLAEKERDDGYGSIPDFFSQRMQNINAMKRGIMYADAINTVSPTYAEEITTEEYGEGLDSLLREKRRRLYGILNGIDYETNNPATDSALAQKFTSRTLHLRKENKTALQKRFGLSSVADQKTFIIGIISRFTRQKGFVLMQPIIEQFLKETESQLVVVGTGDTEIMEFFQNLQSKFPKQVGLNLQFDETIPHLLYAGCDVILIPSKFEPSGLTQMEAMRFGAVPVARKTGGLADTIEDYVPGTDDGTGFLFNDFDSTSLLIALVRAFVNWKHPGSWKKLQKRVMKKDFSWNRSARAYIDLFKKARDFHNEVKLT